MSFLKSVGRGAVAFFGGTVTGALSAATSVISGALAGIRSGMSGYKFALTLGKSSNVKNKDIAGSGTSASEDSFNNSKPSKLRKFFTSEVHRDYSHIKSTPMRGLAKFLGAICDGLFLAAKTAVAIPVGIVSGAIGTIAAIGVFSKDFVIDIFNRSKRQSNAEEFQSQKQD